MKRNTLLLTLIATVSAICFAPAQTINWSAFQNQQKHIINVNAAWDYAATIGLGYGYKLRTEMPSVLTAQISIPAGEDLRDDFKTKIGYQVRLFQAGDLQASVIASGIFRQFHSDLVTLKNFGSEFKGLAGFYKRRWFVAGEFGFDKAIVTRVKSSNSNNDYQSGRDGWYVPTGGNFQYGLQTGYSSKGLDLYLKAGKILDQYLKTSARVPFYAELGVNMRL